MNKPNRGFRQSRGNVICSLIGEILLTILLALSAVMFFTALWLSDVFPGLLLDELVYHMKAPLTGTSPEMIRYYATHYGIPALLITGAVGFLLFHSRRAGRPLYRRHRLILLGTAVLCIAGIGGAVAHMDHRFKLFSYIHSQLQSETFIEDNYVDPASVELRFPSRKRNLIYIYLESVETTFADTENGGAFEANCIPELTALALENECFNGGSGKLNGAVSLSGTGWTMGAIFGQSSGLPLKMSISGNDMNTQEHFYPSVTALGDILEDAGYVNVSLQGTDVSFGGEKLFFTDHGNFRTLDYRYARDHGWIPPGYKVWWGYEDEKLFSFAKTQLSELAAEGAPFNLTLQTMDTHFEDGYVCRLCRDEFGENRYANVFACSSRQVAAFVRWVQAQDFYDDTTIVLAGDHPTMDSDFCVDMSPDYQRKVYFSIINGAPVQHRSAEPRDCSVFDFFPTTLAALGVSIEGDRLGLGVNLYSDEQTLIERFGPGECNRRLSSRSEFMDSKNQTVLSNALLALISESTAVAINENDDYSVSIHAVMKYDVRKIDDIRCAEVEYWDLSNPSAKHHHVTMNRDIKTNGQYTGQEVEITTRDIDYPNLAVAVQFLTKGKSTVRISKVLCTDSFPNYLHVVTQGDYLIFIAACDNASLYLYNNIAALLKQLGANQNLQDHYRAGYILVADTRGQASEPVCEVLSDGGPAQASGEVNGVSYCIISDGSEDNHVASIKLNGEEQAVNSRGINIVLYDRALGTVVDSVCFDTLLPTALSFRR